LKEDAEHKVHHEMIKQKKNANVRRPLGGKENMQARGFNGLGQQGPFLTLTPPICIPRALYINSTGSPRIATGAACILQVDWIVDGCRSSGSAR
jgi:hypothetical protein